VHPHLGAGAALHLRERAGVVAVQVRDHDRAHVAGRAAEVADGRADACGAARDAGVDEHEAAGGDAPAGGPRRPRPRTDPSPDSRSTRMNPIRTALQDARRG